MILNTLTNSDYAFLRNVYSFVLVIFLVAQTFKESIYRHFYKNLQFYSHIMLKIFEKKISSQFQFIPIYQILNLKKYFLKFRGLQESQEKEMSFT